MKCLSCRSGVAALVLALVGLAGCSSSSKSMSAVAPGYYAAPSDVPAGAAAPQEAPPSAMYEEAPSARMSDDAPPRAMKAPAAVSGPLQKSVPGPESVAQKPAPAVQKQQRMVRYNGYAKLKVTSPDATLDEAVKIAEAAKGYVEQRASNVVILRVPVASVREVYAKLLGLGDVVAKSMSAQDVTDAFVAAELRLRTLRASRDRLVELLATTTNEQQKMGLLHEIQRLSEQIVSLEVQVKTLQSLAVFSRITIEAIPKQPHTTSPVDELARFRWIHELTPFGRSVARRGDKLELERPEGMVVLDNDDDSWVAESADGAVMWASKQENEPRGDTAFWLAALRTRLSKDYPNIEDVSIGRYAFLRITDNGETRYRYLVGVLADDDDLRLVEIYYPTPTAEERHGAAVRAAVERGET